MYSLPRQSQSQESQNRLFEEARPTTIDSGTVQDSTSQLNREQDEQGEPAEQQGGDAEQSEQEEPSCFESFFWDRLGGERMDYSPFRPPLSLISNPEKNQLYVIPNF